MKKIFCLITCSWLSIQLFAQTAVDFSVTDTDGKPHSLFADYSNKGKIVVMKLFFVDCPPCNSIAPSVQQKFVEWGSGNGNVQFMEFTTKSGDTNSKVKGYKNKHGITFPSISAEGNSLNAIVPYTNGTYGPFYGTPTFIVIDKNKKVYYDVLFNNLNTVITQSGGISSMPPTQVYMNIASAVPTLPQGVNVILRSKNDPNIRFNLTMMTNGTHNFAYPSTNIPLVDNAEIILECTAPVTQTKISVTDIVILRKHILGLVPFSQTWQAIAADVNTDGKVTVTDMVAIQKIILGLNTTYPNSTPSFKMIPAKIDLNVPSNGGGTVSLDARIVKMGNLE